MMTHKINPSVDCNEWLKLLDNQLPNESYISPQSCKYNKGNFVFIHFSYDKHFLLEKFNITIVM